MDGVQNTEQQGQREGGFRRGLNPGERGSQAPGQRGPRQGGRGAPKPVEEWKPATNLGRLVKAGRIPSLEVIYLHSLPIKEYQIVEAFFSKPQPTMSAVTGAVPADLDASKTGKPILYDEVMAISPVQKQTAAGQRTRFKALVICGDQAGHVGLGVKIAKEVATAIRGALIAAKLSLIPVRRGYWGNKIGDPHTVPMKVSGKCASVRVRLVPAPKGSLVVGSNITKKMLGFAGVHDCFTQTTGHTRTAQNFLTATFIALGKTYKYLSPDLWFPRNMEETAMTLLSSVDGKEATEEQRK